MGGDHAPAEAPETDPSQLIARFPSGRPRATARAYAADLEDLARFHQTSTEAAVRSLLLGPETARRLPVSLRWGAPGRVPMGSPSQLRGTPRKGNPVRVPHER